MYKGRSYLELRQKTKVKSERSKVKGEKSKVKSQRANGKVKSEK